MIDLVPLPAPTPPLELAAPIPAEQVLVLVTEWATALISDQQFVAPEHVSTYPSCAHLWFRDPTALGTLIAWAEQLDAGHRTRVQVDRFADTWHAVLVMGRARGVEVYLHVVTRAALPDLPLDLDDLRRHVEGDRASRALSDVPAVLPEGAPEPAGAEQ